MNPNYEWSREELDACFGVNPLHEDAPSAEELAASITEFEVTYDKDVTEVELFEAEIEAAWDAFDSLLEEEEAVPRGWTSLSDTEIKAAVREIVRTSTSDEEIRQRVADELGYPYDLVIASHTPSDQIGRVARRLVANLGGLITKDGAMVMIMMHGSRGNTISI